MKYSLYFFLPGYLKALKRNCLLVILLFEGVSWVIVLRWLVTLWDPKYKPRILVPEANLRKNYTGDCW